MKVTKFKANGQSYLITDAKPKDGDKTICIQKRNSNFGTIEVIPTDTNGMSMADFVDNVNWKVIIPQEQSFDALHLVEDAKQMYRNFTKINKGEGKKLIDWTLQDCLDNVIEIRSHVIHDDVKEIALQLLNAPK